ncbi:hypothetical protein QBC42DRAFT_168797 [Cladorrhinum samala]|uniref:2EXR domain-containing protein n=1 Tax=Cladorrhinum samala TaxID=585594 RepID=A0AAV9HY22_9PEZI|nr:hypothetical protein QBC42DRAFT_168797 [Cladorrhinum samala]
MINFDMNYHRRYSAQAGERFDNFRKLPAEIRNMIWEYALPESRVYEVLDAPNSKLKTPARKGLMFANVHPEPPPALAAVCRESRNFVLHHYKPLTLGATTKYVDLSRDILLLEPYLLVKRLHRALHFMSQIPMVRDNINRLALGTSYGIYPGIFHPVLSWKVSKTNMGKLLSSLAKFPKLKTLVFIVHQEFQFEFEARFPGTMTPIPPPAHHQPANYGYATPPSSGITSPAAALSPHPFIANLPTPSTFSPYSTPGPFTSPPLASSSLLSSSLLSSSSSLPSSSSSHHSPSSSSPLQSESASPRPQQIHQAYRFKFDIESKINTPGTGPQGRRPHFNSLSYYPLPIDEEKEEDWDLGEIGEEGEWCDPRPTNDDWRRFRKRFRWAVEKCWEGERKELEEKAAGGAPGAKDTNGGGGALYQLKGASLLWRYGSQGHHGKVGGGGMGYFGR